MANRITQAKLDALYAAIGRFVLTWADVETYLDLLVLKLRTGLQDEMPHQLARKIKFARKRLQSLHIPAAGVGLHLLEEIEQLADTRHDYIHGARIGHSFRESKLTVTLGRLLQPPSRPRRKPVKMTAQEIEKTTDRLYDIGGEMLDVLEDLIGH